MYQVLYRKYRSRRFSDVVGQPQVTVTLKNEMIKGRIAHAYLFAGSRGTGKTSCARILSRAVNCLNLKEGDPCGECEMCGGLESGTLFDVVEIDAASNNGVDSIRSLIEESNFTPAVAKYRVYIIDEVHMLSTSAFNALLKTLEEPPEHVVFILATTEVHKLLPTILSRCQRFDFKMIGTQEIAEHLKSIAVQENIELDNDAALLIARLADGAMRDALSILDQCMGMSREITTDTVNTAAGTAGTEYLYAFGMSVAQKEPSKALETISQLYGQSKDMGRLCAELTEYFRNLMLVKTMKNPETVIVADNEQLRELTAQAVKMTLPDIIYALSVLEDTMQKMRFSNQRISLEMAFVKLCAPALDDSSQALVRRLEVLEQAVRAMERSGVTPANSAPAPKSERADEQRQIEIKNESAQKSNSEHGNRVEGSSDRSASETKEKLSVEQLSARAEKFTDWPEVIQGIKDCPPSTAAAFRDSTAYISGNFLLIDASDFAMKLLKKSGLREKLRATVAEITGKYYDLGPYKKPENSEESSDFFSELVYRAKEMGIPVEEN